ncbi:hypothetical protein BV22DRAFT_572694 [Leucogyrophana mollusca]|uniref:Uncharacterized protein n=1 Tax=Leucogyrophana mollusca TaxID=85980 RepID=A0ACB8BFA7_9AGAM|nr:hypothetical protein BV22DRAFT_572694 [Leucogyrophana mollusca]
MVLFHFANGNSVHMVGIRLCHGSCRHKVRTIFVTCVFIWVLDLPNLHASALQRPLFMCDWAGPDYRSQMGERDAHNLDDYAYYLLSC